MKKIIISVLAVLVVLSTGTAAFAASKGGVEIDGALSLSTGPSDFDTGVGFNVGAGFMVQNNPELQIRADLSYYDFDATMFGTDVSYTRMPITVSGRIYIPVEKNVKLFGQLGLELSFDEAEVAMPMPVFTGFGFTLVSSKQKVSETNIGITPGGGVEFFVSDQVSLFALARWHMIADSYFSMNFGAAVHF